MKVMKTPTGVFLVIFFCPHSHAIPIFESLESYGNDMGPADMGPGDPTLRIPTLRHEKNPGWLGYIGDYTTQLYRDY